MARSLTEMAQALFAECKNALEINGDNLRTIIFDNKDTDFGKKIGFSDIKTEDEYKKRVPLSEYADYDGKNLAPNSYTAYPVYVVLTSSGTTGKQKSFTLTEESMNRYSSYLQDTQLFFGNITGKRYYASMFHPVRNGSTILSYAYYTWLEKTGQLDCDKFVGGKELMFTSEDADIPYVKVWLMLSCPDIEALQAVYFYEMTTVFRYLETDWKIILSDMKNRRVSADLSDYYKELLLKNRPSDEWIDKLYEILSEGFDTPIAPRIWKKLRLVCGIGGKLYSFQERQLRHFIGEIPTAYFTYSCSECMMGAAVMDLPYYVLLPRSAYYEFIPIDGDGSETIGTGELVIGNEYEPVVTTFSGLYRYRIGDIIRIRSFIAQSPVFEVVGRRKFLLDIAGEKTDVATATEVVETWASECGIALEDFALCADTQKARSNYMLFVETEDELDLDKCAETFDKIMRRFSPDYLDIRDLGWIAKPIVYKVGDGDIAASAQCIKKMAHSKPQIFLSEEQMKYLIERSEPGGHQ